VLDHVGHVGDLVGELDQTGPGREAVRVLHPQPLAFFLRQGLVVRHLGHDGGHVGAEEPGDLGGRHPGVVPRLACGVLPNGPILATGGHPP
jgi:hypothetical protein